MDDTLRKLQLLELQILKDIATVCEKHHIRYYLAYGTLLGAVRHKGFIPWDDDIDLLMPREDYIKFHEVIQKEMGDKYTIESDITKKDYYSFSGRLRLNGTTYPEEPLEDVQTHTGIFVDLMPLDDLKTNKGLLLNLRGYAAFWMSALRAIAHGTKFSQEKFRTMGKMLYPFALPFRGELSRKIFETLSMSKSQKDGDYFANLTSFGNWKKSLVPKDVYGEGVKLQFEDAEFWAPKDYDTVLKQCYGDYMCPPPVEQQVAAHHTADVNFGKYATFVEDCLKKDNKKLVA